MSQTFKATDVKMLIEQIHSGALKYCDLSIQQRQKDINSNDLYMSIVLWDGRFITATPISCSLLTKYKLHEIEDHIIMDGVDIKVAIEASLLCTLANIKSRFATFTDCRKSSDILLWELKSS